MVGTALKLYTRTGDAGQTGLFGGGRVSKSHPRVTAYGEVDELNAVLAVARTWVADPELDARLAAIQHQLFTVGADLATPPAAAASAHVLRVPAEWSGALELEIDQMSAAVPPLRTFVLPGGTAAAAGLHLARTVCRRAERSVVLAIEAGEEVGADVPRFLNRLSDWLFAAARLANAQDGVADVPWEPPSTV